MAMKVLIGLLAGLLLFSNGARASTQSATGSGVSKEVTLNNLRSRVPRGATVTDTNCITIGTGDFSYRYRCTIKWE